MNPHRLALVCVVVAAFAIRVFGFDWDEGQFLHPDEFHVADVTSSRVSLPMPLDLDNLFDPRVSTLNPRLDDPEGRPRQFAYGALPLYMTDLAAEGLNRLNQTEFGSAIVPGPPERNWHNVFEIYKVGRALSMMIDTLTVVVVYLLGRQVAGRGVGLLSATVYAFTPMASQLAHFYTTDAWLTFFVAMSLLASAKAARLGGSRWFAVAGVSVGLAIATKPSALSLGGILAVAIAYDVWRRSREGDSFRFALTAAPERIAIAGVAVLIAFAIFEPYALLRPSAYVRDFQEQSSIQRGVIDVPYTRQYVGTVPIVYHLEQVIRWGLGPVGGMLALLGSLLLAWRVWWRRGAVETVLLAWLIGYLFIIAVPESKFLRYVAPLTPVFAVCGGLCLQRLLVLVHRRLGGFASVGVGAALIAGLVAWSAATTSIYAAENPRLAASRWIYTHVPSGSSFSALTWDRTLPLDLGPGINGRDRQYEWVELDAYHDAPTYADLHRLGESLASFGPTADAAFALSEGDYRLAADLLRLVAPEIREAPETERVHMADRLYATADGMSPTSAGMQRATREGAEALRDGAAPDGLFEARWAFFVDEIIFAGDNEISSVIYRQLEQVDYYIITSNRVPAGMANMPWRYPVQGQFFALLEAEQLGYQLVGEFTSHPRLGPLSFNDDSADEAWINYDHPRVLIFQKVDLVSRDRFNDLLRDARSQAASPTRHPVDDVLMLDQPVGERPVVADARWSAALTDNGWVALGFWLVLLIALQAAGWPWANLLLGRFADGGWSFARLIALLGAGYLVWLGASVRAIEFRAVWCVAALLIVGSLGWLLWSRSQSRFERVIRKPIIVASEGVFWGIFAIFLVFRLLNPDSWHPVWGGEKPMEFAHLNATLRSPYFPPHDPWFSDGYLNYYYYGLYLVAYLLKLTGIPSEIAFNLAQPTVIAFLGVGAFGLAATLGPDLVATRRFARRLAIPAGILGAIMLLAIGNLVAFFNFLREPAAGVGDGFGYYTWDPSRAIPNTITEFPYFTALYADLHAHVVAWPITLLVITVGYALVREPRNTFLAIIGGQDPGPRRWLLVGRSALLALALGSLSATNAWDVPTSAALVGVAIFLATTAIKPLTARLAVSIVWTGVIGLTAFTMMLPFFRNYVALFGSVGRVQEPTSFWDWAGHVGGLLAIVTIGLVMVLTRRSPPEDGIRPLAPMLLLVALLPLASVADGQSLVLADSFTLGSLLILAFVVVITLVLALVSWENLAATNAGGPWAWTPWLIVPAGLVVVSLAVSGWTVLALALAVTFTATCALFPRGSQATRFVALLVAGGAALIAALEVFYLADNLAGGPAYRMNSIFKFYNQVWTMLTMSAAVLILHIAVIALRDGAPWERFFQPTRFLSVPGSSLTRWNRASGTTSARKQGIDTVSHPPPEQRWARVGLIVSVLVISLSAFYPALATGPRLAQRFVEDPRTWSFNALEWMEYGQISDSGDCLGGDRSLTFADDRAVIDWFNREVPGTPVILEASIGVYRCNGSRISNATGLPTVLGWAGHQTQQRWPEGINTRVGDVRLLYSTTDIEQKRSLLNQYDVEFILVGELERRYRVNRETLWADPAGLATFDSMVGEHLDVVFQSGETIVYRVIRDVA